MTKIYVSSTFKDLEEHRRVVYETLRKLRHDVIAMEDYVATDQRPVAKCAGDVEACDIYLGLFAWRYGYIPTEQNPEGLSVTELEYRAAVRATKPCLLFLLDENAPWPPKYMDASTGEGRAGQGIRDLRDYLSDKYVVSHFSTPEELGTLASVAVTNQLQRQDAMNAAMIPAGDGWLSDVAMYELGPSLTGSILNLIDQAIAGTIQGRLVQVHLREGNYWWSTRLYLLAALATDFTAFEQFVFAEGDEGNKKFVGFAAPLAIQRALAEKHPAVELAYRTAWLDAMLTKQGSRDRAQQLVEAFTKALSDEKDIRIVVSSADIRKWLGAELVTSGVEFSGGPATPVLLRKIVQQTSPFVALTTDGQLTAVVDRIALAGRLAGTALQQAGGVL